MWLAHEVGELPNQSPSSRHPQPTRSPFLSAFLLCALPAWILHSLHFSCQVLDDYEQYGGLSVSYGIFSDPKLRLARRFRETPMEVTNYTLGVPHPLVKCVCVANHTSAPTHNMPHCCSYKEGYFGVDENFEPVGAKGQPCWFQVTGWGLGGSRDIVGGWQVDRVGGAACLGGKSCWLKVTGGDAG